jgi:threonine synthase
VACASTGNLANSVAAHAAEGRLKSYIFIPADLEQGKVLATLVYNPTLVAVHGTYDEVNRLCSEIADKYRWAFVNVNFRPYYSEGSKSYGFEIVEQLGWRTPQHIIVPCAGGSLITKIWKAIKEMKMLGLIDGPVTTKMHAAQALGCGPIVTMIKTDTDVLKPVRPNTIAKSLAIGNPADGYYAYKVTKESGGFGEHATDEEIIEGMLLLARTEGIFTETAGGVVISGLRHLAQAGAIKPDDLTVAYITGNGLKTLEVVSDTVNPLRIKPSMRSFEAAMKERNLAGV